MKCVKVRIDGPLCRHGIESSRVFQVSASVAHRPSFGVGQWITSTVNLTTLAVPWGSAFYVNVPMMVLDYDPAAT